MKYLILLRHANAKNPGGYNADFDRPLSKKGRAQCPETGAELCRLMNDGGLPAPEMILSSPSTRTIETVELLSTYFAENLSERWSPIVNYENALYLPQIDEILASIWGGTDVESLLVCSHNPGVSYLAETLFGRIDGPLDTAGWVAGSFETESWQNINKVNSRLIDTGGPHRLKCKEIPKTSK